jgi:hypothetical protein
MLNQLTDNRIIEVVDVLPVNALAENSKQVTFTVPNMQLT